ncbi:MAG: ATP-binding protein [SAR324 cluster bacterium]|nr:ATP-binding protein [SAR324 cluster bacterium]
MIINFKVDNFMSFKDEVSFSLTASRERQHGDRVPKISKYQTRILPIAVIYGGNASGKTNFFKALNFVKRLVVGGTQPDSMIPIETFRLDTDSIKKPSRFELELLINDSIYEFSFIVTRKEIIEEKLVQMTSTSKKTLYHRREGKPNFDRSLSKDQFLQFAFKGTRDNQLFLTNSVSQKVGAFRPIYDWFKNTLELIAPDSRFEPFEYFFDKGHPLYNTMNEMLPQLDTGISQLGGEEIPFDNLPLPDILKSKLQEDVKEGTTIRFLSGPTNDRFTVSRKEGELVAKKLVTYHPKSDGTNVKFEMRQESDGSQRVIDLLPAFLEISASQSQKVCVIDEVDRSLHTLLTRQLLEAYLANCSTESRSQLLITTHDVLLMDQKLLRRDEMWITERDKFGSSTLYPFSDFKDVRYDKDIRKSYLQGRLGGIPRVLLNRSPLNCEEEG